MKGLVCMIALVLLVLFCNPVNAAQQQRDQRPGDMKLAWAEQMTGSVVVDRSNQRAARVDSIVLNLRNGNISYVVLRQDRYPEFGDRLVSVPWEKFTVTANERLRLDADRSVLARAPTFEPNARGYTLWDPDWNRDVYRYWGANEYARLGRWTQRSPKGELLLVRADALKGSMVINRQGEDLAEVERVLLDLSIGRISNIVLATGGFLDIGDRHIPVPYERFVATGDERLIFATDQRALEQAPSVARDEWWRFEADPGWNRKTYAYWGVQYPYSARIASGRKAAPAQPAPMRQGGQR